MTDRPLTHEERVAIARAPITVGILATNFNVTTQPKLFHAGHGEHPTAPVFNQGRLVGTRAVKALSPDTTE